MFINMFCLITLQFMALQLLYFVPNVNCLTPLEVNPYESVFKMLLREPPINLLNKNRDNDEIKEQWVDQPVDHFDANNTQTWKMRYLVNDNSYRTGAPIFVFVGGEWEISQHVLQSGHFYDMAKQQEALMFYTEHRFYGQSWPKRHLSSENLKYLSVLQSLEDLKKFLLLKKSTIKDLENTKIALVGGSYSGSMVAWFMKLYPDLADVAWASSAPLVAKMDFNEYMAFTMTSVFQKGGAACGLKLEEAFKGLTKLMRKDRAFNLMERFKMCKSFDSSNPLDRQAFFNGLGNYFAGLAQSYRKTSQLTQHCNSQSTLAITMAEHEHEGDRVTGKNSFIPTFCLSFTNLDSNPTEALIKYLTELFSLSAELKIREEENYCLDFSYEGMKSVFGNENDLKAGTRPWLYQTCHEFGWFSTTSSRTSNINTPPLLVTSSKFIAAFGGQVPLTYFQQLCQDVFGYNNSKSTSNNNSLENLGHGKTPPLTLQQLHDRALTINKLFGGFSNVSKRVIFTHGLLDPWRAAGLQYGPNVLLIKDYSHVEDMGSINFQDTVEINVAKLKVAAFINRNLRHF